MEGGGSMAVPLDVLLTVMACRAVGEGGAIGDIMNQEDQHRRARS